MEIVCSKCGAPAREGAKFCRKCGNKLVVSLPVKEQPLFCDQCGAECEPGSTFCDSCGASLTDDTAAKVKDDPWGDGFFDKKDEKVNEDDAWGEIVGGLTAFEDAQRFASFEYGKRADGSVIINGVKDQYAITVKVPEGVTVIGDGAFEGVAAIEVALPEGVTTIGKRAFFGCSNLKNINIPSTVMLIADEAFAECANLAVTIPEGVQIIGKDALRGTKNESMDKQRLEQKKQDDFKKGMELYSSKKYEEAFPYLAAAVENGFDDAVEPLGVCYQQKGNWAEAFNCYKRMADAGVPSAQYRVAWCYNNGNGVDMSKQTSVTYFKMAAMQGHVWSMIYLSEHYRFASGVEQDYKEAFKWMLAAAKTGEPRAECLLGECYYYGRGTDRDYDQSFKWFTKAANGGDAYGQYILGESYKYGQGTPVDKAQAAKWYEKAAKQERPEAQDALGELYLNGNGVAKDEKRAFELFKKSAQNGRDWGMFHLAECYEKGQGTAKNLAEAHRWFSKAANTNGNAYMLAVLGDVLRSGRCGTKNEKEAFKCYKLSAEKGRDWSAKALGECYANGWGVEKNLAEAYKWFCVAADKGLAWGLFRKGQYLYRGDGVELNREEGVKCIKRASEMGLTDAMWLLAYCYYEGSGIKQDRGEALKWAKKIAEVDKDGPSYNNLGDYYHYGWHGTVDHKAALENYRKAADLGYAKSQYRVGVYYLEGKGGLPVDKIKGIEWLMKASAGGCKEATEKLNKLG